MTGVLSVRRTVDVVVVDDVSIGVAAASVAAETEVGNDEDKVRLEEPAMAAVDCCTACRRFIPCRGSDVIDIDVASWSD